MTAELDRRLPVRTIGRLAAPDDLPYPVSVSLGPGGPVVLWAAPGAHEQLYARWESAGGASFPSTRAANPPSVVIAAYSDDLDTPAETVAIDALPTTFPMVQPLGERGYVVVGARCDWLPEGPENNALVIDHDGAVAAEGCLGDGISRLQTDSNGSIWAGYFDEGVFGNNGWGGPGPAPLGAAGIVQWSADFEKLWEQPSIQPLIADCYALNVSDASVWACTYTEFPLIEIRDGGSQVYPTTGVHGPRGIVVSEDRIALIGGYRDPLLVTTGRLNDGAFEEDWHGHLTLPDGSPLPIAAAHCRGSRANFFAGPNWHVFDLDEVD